MSLIRVTGGRVRVDDQEPRLIKLSGQGPQGASGVAAATAPVVYTAGTQTVSLTTDQANGVPVLDSNGKVKTAQLPNLSITDTFVVASQAAMLALTAETGDVAVRTDESKSYILTATPASTLANWQILLSPPDTVLSVAGKTGVVTLANTDITGLGSLATKNTVTSSDITDGTIVNADINSSAAIADSKLNLTTTVSGTAISASNKIVDAATHENTYEQPGSIMLYPWAAAGTTGGVVMSSDNARGTLFTATRPFTVTKIIFDVASAATNDDPVQVGIFDATGTGTLLASSTSAARGVTTAGPKTVSLSSSYTLVPGTKYYVCIAVDYSSGTGFTLRSQNYGTGGMQSVYGTSYGLAMTLNTGGVSTLTTGMWSAGSYTSGIQPFFVLLNT